MPRRANTPKKPKAIRLPKYPYRDLYAKFYEQRLGCVCWAEWRFHPTRMWRFDYAFPEQRIAIEIDGGIYIGGRHSRGIGQHNDMEKMNAAAELGWRVFHYTPDERLKMSTLIQLNNALNGKDEEQKDR